MIETVRDYFVLSGRLGQAQDHVRLALEVLVPKPHRAVLLRFVGGAASQMVQVQAPMPKISGERPMGPPQAPSDWSACHAALESAIEATGEGHGVTATGEQREKGQDMIDSCYQDVGNLLRAELAGLYDLDSAELDAMANTRSLVKRPLNRVLHTRGAQRPVPSRALQWLGGVMVQLAAVLCALGSGAANRVREARSLAYTLKGQGRNPFAFHAPSLEKPWLWPARDLGAIVLRACGDRPHHRSRLKQRSGELRTRIHMGAHGASCRAPTGLHGMATEAARLEPIP